MKLYDDFMCICTDEPRKKAEDCLARVYKELNCGPENLLSSVVFALNWDLGAEEEDVDGPYYYANISQIHNDQWSVVSAVVKGFDEENKTCEIADILVQCDLVEHGVARVWELAKEAVTDARANA